MREREPVRGPRRTFSMYASSPFSQVLTLFFLVLDVEVLQLVRPLAGGEDADPVAQVLLLEKLLREVLEILLAVRHRGADRQNIVVHRQADLVGERALAPVELRVLLEELLEVAKHVFAEDAVGGRDAAVNLEDLLALGQLLLADVAARANLSANGDHLCRRGGGRESDGDDASTET
ncbi:60S ribosomal protein L22, putative [Leishmania tarentolae]|uniref:60S ribosomal protein L22, putative n=1 Tax=Leishmania tarentolae TaxID=5689 RepID=A0A640KUH4_LEITA|nr:60S ribosomal protein L22, putative [Leishmania tarentolae]